MKREGIVKWFKEEKGYGRIMLDDENTSHVFVHFSSILPDNERLSFDLIENQNSTDQKRVAENVMIISG